MCPLVNELKRRSDQFEVVVCVTGQHRRMLDQVLDTFDVVPDCDLDIMSMNQTLFDITCHVLLDIKAVLESVAPDIVLVHGDTTTSFAPPWRHSICISPLAMLRQACAQGMCTPLGPRNSIARQWT